MTYNVFGGTLTLTQSVNQSTSCIQHQSCGDKSEDYHCHHYHFISPSNTK